MLAGAASLDAPLSEAICASEPPSAMLQSVEGETARAAADVASGMLAGAASFDAPLSEAICASEPPRAMPPSVEGETARTAADLASGVLAGAASFDAPLSEAVCAPEPPSAMLHSVEGETARAAASVASGMLAGAASFDGPLGVTSAIDVTSGIAVGTELSCDAPSGEAAHASKLLSETLLSMVGETAEATVNMTSGIAVGAELSCDAPSGEAARASELLGEMLLSTVGETAKALSSILVSHEPPWIEPMPSEPPSSELSLSEQRRSNLLPIEAPLRALRPSELPTGELSSAEQESSSDAPSGEAICDFELPTELPSSAKVEIVEAAASEAGGKLRSHEPKSERRIASSSVEAPCVSSAAAELLSALSLLSELSLSVSPSELPLGGPPSEPPLVRSDAPLGEAARASELLSAMLLGSMGEAAEAAVDVTSGVVSGAELLSDAPLGEATRASELLSAMLLSAMGEAAEAAVDVRSGVASSVEVPSVASTAVVLQSVASVARGALSNVAPLSFERVKAADVTASGSSERVEQHCNSSLRCEQMTVVLEGAVAPPTRVLVQW